MAKKPTGMTLTKWQVALRKQMAEEETFGISCIDDQLLPGEYTVRNPKTKSEYKVVYRSGGSQWNYSHAWTSRRPSLARASTWRQ